MKRSLMPACGYRAMFRQVAVTGMVVLLLACLASSANSVLLDEPVAEATVESENGASISSAKVELLRKQVQELEELEPDVKTRALDNIQKSAEAIDRAVKLETQAPADIASMKKVSSNLKSIQATIEAQNGEILTEIDEDVTLPELLAALAQRQPRLQKARSDLTAAEAEPARRAERRATISADLAAQPVKKAEIEKELASPNPPDELPAATAARRALLMARLREITAQAPAWQAELSKYDAEKAVDLSAMRIQLARTEVNRLQKEIDELDKRIAEKRSQDARYVADQLKLFADGEAVSSPTSLQGEQLFDGKLTDEDDLAIATSTAQNAITNISVTTQLAMATKALGDAQNKQKQLEAKRTQVDRKIELVGLTGVVGLELRSQLRKLDDPGVLRNECRARQEEMSQLQYKRFEIEDQLPNLRRTIEKLKSENSDTVGENIQLRLTTDKYRILTELDKNYGELFARLGDLDLVQNQTIDSIEDFDAFIRERVLWIRSHQLPSLEDAYETVQTARWLVSPTHWQLVTKAIASDADRTPAVYLIYGTLALLLLSVQRRFRKNLTAVGLVAAKPTCRDFQPTVRAAILTAVLSVAWSVIPGFIAWRLLVSSEVSGFSRACGQGLLAFSAAFVTLNLLRHLCRPSGLGLAHFDWPSKSVTELRPQLYSMMMLLLPIVFLENLLHSIELNQSRDALERLLFIVSLTVLTIFQWKILHPTTGVFREFVASRSTHWTFRLRWPLFWISVAVPLALAVLAAIGFFYTAYELSWRLHVITWAFIGLFVARSFLVRWYVVRHRELRIQQARKKRQELIENPDTDDTSNIPQSTTADAAVDLREVSRQTRGLINSGLCIIGLVVTWFVWVDVLPALGVLNRFELWPTTVDVTVKSVDDSGMESFRTEPRIESITIADALISIIIGLLTVSAARNIPGLLEITLLNKLPLEPATRYAVKMIARYVIVVVGAVLAFNAIGVGWAKVQWLAAALTVGLGFGLQEIFANFVSGLIILFERPVRISDVVTIGDVTGVVSRIQIRATTIVDWDRKEYIVPNKEFVTGRLLNWTLSDKTNRVVIDVGVAYGDDTQKARELLLKVAESHSDVLKDPPPIATFEQFGDSALNLRLRCYLPNLDNRLQTITSLHEAIDREFKAASIEIAFPQQDLHIRTMAFEKNVAEQPE